VHEIHAATRLAATAVQAAGRISMGRSAADIVSSRTLEICTGGPQAMSASKAKIIVIMLLLGCLSGMMGLPASAELSKGEKEETPLKTILHKWAEADAKIREMHVRYTETYTDRFFDKTTIIRGQASIKTPDLWRIDWFDKQGRMLGILLLADQELHWF
jgi:hypothetical protein